MSSVSRHRSDSRPFNIAMQSPPPATARPLRVLHVLNSISPQNGGPTHALWLMLRAARSLGMSADVATTNGDANGNRADVSLDCFLDVQGFRVRYFRCQTRFYAVSLPMLRWLWTRVRDYDVIHVHGLFTFAPIAAAWCARLRRVPYIVVPHGVLNLWGRENRRPVLKRASIFCVERPLLRHASSVQFTSNRELEEFTDLGIGVKSEVIAHPVSIESAETAAVPADIAPALNALAGRPAVLFLARIHPIKGLDLLLQAFAGVRRLHPAAVLLIAGSGEPELVNALRRLALDLGIGESVRWIGFVEGPLKRWLLERANVFVLPSWSENFGLAVAEAMAAGVPVVVTKGVGIAEIVAAAGCGCVTDNTASSLQRAIESLLADAATAARMGQAGKQAVRGELSLARFAQRLQSLYGTAARRAAF
jgi:glycosyltransferase involved in cell wall biosynthesis